MLIGLGIPTCREGLAYPCGFGDLRFSARLATLAERLGFDSLWANDHFATPRVVKETSPAPPNFYEPIITFAYLASQVSRLRFVLATVVMPMREPVLLAKQIATLDWATDGRVVLGLGIGAYPEEFRTIMRPAGKVNRGQILEESVGALRQLFAAPRSHYDGHHVGFGEIEVFPKPVQRPLPIYLSGNSPEGLDRAGRIADGWILASASLERTAESIARLRTAVIRAERTPDEVAVCVQTWVSIGETEEEATRRLKASQHFQRLRALNPDKSPSHLEAEFRANNLLGTPADIREKLNAYERSGVDHMGLIFLANDADDLVTAVELFGTEGLRCDAALTG